MAGYQPLKIVGMKTGLVQEREEFILPDDAYPKLENAYVWRERIRRRQGLSILGRLQREVSAVGATTNLITDLGLESTASLVPGSINIQGGGGNFWTDPAQNGVITRGVGAPGTINYATGAFSGPTTPLIGGTFSYYPGLPVMGLRLRELNGINVEQTVAFDTTYAYIFVGSAWQEFIPGTTWTGTDSDFFWSTNYWVGDGNRKIFWVTNFSGTGGDPIRYTNGISWIDFSPTINAAGDLLTQCLALLPFRGRLLAFNTLEGTSLGTSVAFTNRIRWAAIGNPFSDVSAIVTTVNANAWRDDIRGQGGFLDIPTSESITAVGFVRDNLVIYCERSTWQLRYTGRSIAPFQIERVNSELGSESTFSAVQFDTSLVGIGDKGIVECDSYKSERIDIKIPDLVFEFHNDEDGTKRIHGIRDFQQRLAYWIYPYSPGSGFSTKFPNRRLVYNYENDSWAIFTDSLTALGNYQPVTSERWQDFTVPFEDTWEQSNFPWINFPASFPALIGGNQQGYVMYLGSNLQPKVSNDATLSLQAISVTTVVTLTSLDHNLVTGQVIEISQIPSGTPYATSLNGEKFGIVVIDKDSFQIWSYNSSNGTFDIVPLSVSEGTYVGLGLIGTRDGFSIVSKKFNFIDEGQNIQLGYIDVLTVTTSEGAISLNLYLDYNDNSAINIVPQNQLPNVVPLTPDTFFNSIVPTTQPNPSGLSGNKFWHRIFCPVRGAFLTLEWTLSNAQLVGPEQENDVQIDAQILWLRRAGKLLPVGI